MKKGFTLIELLGIITILGLILIVAIPMLIESNNAARTNEAEADSENLRIAAEDYMSSCYSLGLCAENEYKDFLYGNAAEATVSKEELVSGGFVKDSEKVPDNVTLIKENGKIVVKK